MAVHGSPARDASVFMRPVSPSHCQNGLRPPRALAPVNYRRAGLNKDAVDARNSRPAFHRSGRERRGSAELRIDAAAAALRDVPQRTRSRHAPCIAPFRTALLNETPWNILYFLLWSNRII